MSPDPDSSDLPDLPRLAELHRELNRTATGGVDDPRSARSVLPPLAPPGSAAIPLPEVALPSADLAATLAARRSAYRYGATPPTLTDLAALLRGALGRQRTVRLADGRSHALGVAPSAGGLASLATYVVVRVPGGPGDLPLGVHHVDLRAAEPEVVPVRLGNPSPFLARALDQPEFAERAGVVVALVGRLDATLGKYPARHYRTLHVDAGVALGHLYLAATALGLPGCAVMGFDDTALDALLDLPAGRFTAVLFATGAPSAD